MSNYPRGSQRTLTLFLLTLLCIFIETAKNQTHSTKNSSAIPYILVSPSSSLGFQMGYSYPKQRITKTAGGTIYMMWRSRFSGQVYNAIRCDGTDSLIFPRGSESQSGGTLQRAGSSTVTPGEKHIQIGHQTLGASLLVTVSNSIAKCSATQILDTVCLGPPTFGDPQIHAVNDSLWIAVLNNFDADTAYTSRTIDAGETWSAPASLIQAQWLQAGITGHGNLVYAYSASNPAAPDTSLGYEILYNKSTDAGATWGGQVNASQDFDNPDFEPFFGPGGPYAIMDAGDTLHIIWSSVNRANPDAIPGGKINHLAVAPNGTFFGETVIAQIPYSRNAATLRPVPSWPIMSETFGSASLSLKPGSGQNPPILYAIWVQANANAFGEITDTVAPAGSNSGVVFNPYPELDIYCAASSDNGRTWDAAQNITQTRNPGCTDSTPCESEEYAVALSSADSLIYILSVVDAYAGAQEMDAQNPGPNTNANNQVRLYLAPARTPQSCPANKGDINRDGFLTSADVVVFLNCVFLGLGACDLCYSDLNCDTVLTAADVVIELNYVFLGVAPPC